MKGLDRFLKPITHHMRGKILLSHVSVLFITLTLTAFLLATLIQSYFVSAVERNLETQAELLAAAILTEPNQDTRPSTDQAAINTLQQQQLSNLNVQVERKSGQVLDGTDNISAHDITDIDGIRDATVEVSALIDTRIQIIDLSGNIVIDSHSGELELEPDLNNLLHQALAGTSSSEQIHLGDQKWLYYSAPIESGEGIIGAILLSLPLQDVSVVLSDLTMRWLLSIMISLPLSILLAVILSNSLTRPIVTLTDAVNQLRHGNYDYPLPRTGEDEIGDLNRAFESMRSRLKDTERMRSQFISDVSHELRTPLTGIKGLVESLADGAAADPEYRDQFLSSIDRETDRLIRLVNDLMLLSRVDSHALNLSTTLIDLRDVVHSAVEITFSNLDPSSFRLSLNVPLSPVYVIADQDRIEQALINLLENAKQYSDGSPFLYVTVDTVRLENRPDVTRIDEGVDQAERLERGDWAVVSVTDAGPGISKQDLPFVFDRFYRADPARSRSRGGSGLGLSISRAIIEAHAGKIWIESPPRKHKAGFASGTTAAFALPLQK